MIDLIITLLFLLIFLGIVYQTLSLFILKKKLNSLSKTKYKAMNHFPTISILKPLKGIEDQLEENLESFFNLDYPDFEIIFGVHSIKDPSVKIVKSLMKKHKGINAKLITSDFKVGLNPKINNLHNMFPNSSGQMILISDSNTRVEPEFLKIMTSVFEDKNVGLVTATIRGIGAKNMASIMENIHLNSFVSPGVFTAAEVAKIPVVVGKAILLPRIVLNKLGGFESFKNYLAEDYLMGARVEDLGYKVLTSPVFVNNLNEKWTINKFVNRHTRWAKMRAKIRLHTYIAEIISNPISNSFILGLIFFNEIGIIQFLLVSLIKTLLDSYSLKQMNSDIKIHQMLLNPIKDLIIGLVWYIPFINSTVSWRDNLFKIGKNSILEPVLQNN